ncbi:MAG: ABC transporter permease [Cyclobacteriaceae bacterium]|nr:ABC transporter permease [Cyclobacteriaceae bacterium]
MKVPPKYPLQFLRWFCREDYLDEIEGDLMEVFIKQSESSPRKAKWNFGWSVIKYFRPEFLKPFKKTFHPESSDMYKNYFKVALRNLTRHHTFSIINIAGLSLGITCALFIFLIVNYELSYDRYHVKADRIYRVNNGEPGNADTGTPHGLAEILRSEFPEMEDVGIIFKLNPEQSNIEINQELFRENNTYFVQPQIFKLLDFTWLQGKPESLTEPHHAVVAQSIADKYFRGDAIGKTLKLNNGSDFTITGILADPPVNSDFPVRIVLSYATLEKLNQSHLNNRLDAGSNSYSQTLFSLRAGIDPQTIDTKLRKMVERHVAKDRQQFVSFFIQPISDIHFNVGNFNQRTIAKETISTLQLIGLFILVIACINFINLASAQAIRRAKEVGVRKTLGGSRNSLVFQFLCETFLITLTALLLAFGVTSQVITFSESLFSIPLSNDALFRMDTLLFMGATLILVTLLAGFYPAFVLSGFLPAHAMKGAVSGIKSLFVRKSLITFQFLISQVLIVCTILVIRQTNYFLSAPLGFNKEAVITFDLPNSKATHLSTLRNSLLTHSEIENVSFSLNTPSATINTWWANLRHESFSGDERSAEVKYIDSTYLSMFEIQRVAGTTVLPDLTGKSIIVNEALVKEIGIMDPEQAIGEKVSYWNTDAIIIGVVKDFQTVTLQEGIHPVILTSTGYYAKGSVKIDMTRVTEALSIIEKHWKETFTGNYFTWAFLDDQLATFYHEEKKIASLLITFASIAICIGCIGLFGLIAFVATQRAKEVSIRKILGATVAHLTAILSGNFIKLVLIAGMIAWPIAYYIMESWLQGIANRIELLDNAWVFVLSLLVTVALAIITLSTQTIKAALENPVKNLRSE